MIDNLQEQIGENEEKFDELDQLLYEKRDFDQFTFDTKVKKLNRREIKIDDPRALEEEKFLNSEEARHDSNNDDDYPTFGDFKHWNRFGAKDVVFEYLDPFKDMVSPYVTKKDLEELFKSPLEEQSWVLIDVRSFNRASDYKIPNSVNIPMSDWGNKCVDMEEREFYGRYGIFQPPLDKSLIFFSDNADESEMACLLATTLGYSHVFNFRGGVQDWFGTEFKIKYRLHPRVQKDIIQSLTPRNEDNEMESYEAMMESDDLVGDDEDPSWQVPNDELRPFDDQDPGPQEEMTNQFESESQETEEISQDDESGRK